MKSPCDVSIDFPYFSQGLSHSFTKFSHSFTEFSHDFHGLNRSDSQLLHGSILQAFQQRLHRRGRRQTAAPEARQAV